MTLFYVNFDDVSDFTQINPSIERNVVCTLYSIFKIPATTLYKYSLDACWYFARNKTRLFTLTFMVIFYFSYHGVFISRKCRKNEYTYI